MAWTTVELLAGIRRSGSIPTSTLSATADADLLAYADDELQESILPLALRAQEEFYVRTQTVTVTSGTDTYPIPRRAIASRLRDVVWVANSVKTHLPRLAIETITGLSTITSGTPAGFTLDAANLTLVPIPNQAAQLLLRYHLRPGRLVATTNCRQLTAITADTDYSGAASVGRTRLQWTSALSTTTLGTVLDVISGSPPFEGKVVSSTYASAGGSVTSIDIASSGILNTLSVGDWVVTEDTSPVIQAPVELHGLLVQRTAARILLALGYGDEAAQQSTKADQAEAKAMLLLTPRTDGNPKRLTGGIFGTLNKGSGWLGW